MNTRLLRVPEVAKLIDTSIPRTYELLRQGVIPAVRLGSRQVRVSEQALLDWIKRGGCIQPDVDSRKLPKDAAFNDCNVEESE